MVVMIISFTGCPTGKNPADPDIFNRDNLVAWCIVPFDAMNRTPEERAIMLKDMQISQFAYDYRDSHLASFKEEIHALKNHRISLRAVWLWVEPEGERLLNRTNETVLEVLQKTGTRTELWVSFPGWVFRGSDEENLQKAVKALTEIIVRAEETGCTVALYNHGDWFGEPENQVRIIEAIGSEKLRMVYNFHHGHHHMDQFEALFNLMVPYLSAVNINGMSAGGPKIITLGEGNRELEMLKIIKASGYRGPIGIIGHTDGEDIRNVLERNLKGLERLKRML